MKYLIFTAAVALSTTLAASTASAQNWSGTSRRIGNTTYHSWNYGSTGTSRRIGKTTYHDFSFRPSYQPPVYQPYRPSPFRYQPYRLSPYRYRPYSHRRW